MEYYLRSVYLAVILSCVLLRVSGTVSSRNKCCDEGVLLLFSRCEDGKNLSVSCDNENILNLYYHNGFESSQFFIANDSMGEYMDVPSQECIFREPNYCVGTLRFPSEIVWAVACRSRRIWYNDLTNKPSHQLWIDQFLRTMLTVLNFISTLALFVTAFLYYLLREVQDTQGHCAFHLSLNLCLMHAGVCYIMVFDSTDGILPDACITNWYLQIYVGLTAFSWCVIVGHSSWTLAKADTKIEDEKLMTRYRYFGYGFPALIVLLCNLVAHAEKLYTTFEFEIECFNHQTPVILYCVAVPVFTLSAANYYFFFSAQKQLSDSPALKMRCEQSTLKLMKYRLAINGKLFIITGVSWSMGFIGYALHATFEYSSFGMALVYYLYFLEILVSSEGIFIFLVLVAFRKRVVSATFRHPFLKDRGIFPAKWQTVVDSETAVERGKRTWRLSGNGENSGILKSAMDVNS